MPNGETPFHMSFIGPCSLSITVDKFALDPLGQSHRFYIDEPPEDIGRPNHQDSDDDEGEPETRLFPDHSVLARVFPHERNKPESKHVYDRPVNKVQWVGD